MKQMKVLNISQPFAHQVVWGNKNVENRTKNSKFRGTILIYASKTKRAANFEDQDTLPDECSFGAVIGAVNLVDCIGEDEVNTETDEYFSGPYGYVLQNRIGFKVPIYVQPPKGAVTWWTLDGKQLEECLSQLDERNLVPLESSDKIPKVLKYKPSERLAVIIGEEPLTMREALDEFIEYCYEFEIEVDRERGIIKADKCLEEAFGIKIIDVRDFQELIKKNSKKLLC